MLRSGSFIILLPAMILLSILAGCAKEYSFEGALPPRQDTIIVPGGGPGNTNPPGVCAACVGNDTQIENRWSLHVGNLLYCGIIDTAIATPERTGFTFFGPSACSADSGMVITIYLDGIKLDHDFASYTTTKVGFYYYDNITPSYMLITQAGQPFSLTIDSYEHATRMMRGKFSGYANTSNGGSNYVNDGNFKVKVR